MYFIVLHIVNTFTAITKTKTQTKLLKRVTMKNVKDVLPLSQMQHLMLIKSLSGNHSSSLVNVFRYSIIGPVNENKLQAALEQLLARHDSLRTCFVWEKIKQPMQVVRQVAKLQFNSSNLSEYPSEEQLAYLKTQQSVEEQYQFTLTKAPLLRFHLFKLSTNHYQFWLTRHHIIMDGWSHNQLFEELDALYSDTSGALAIKPSSFKPYIEWFAKQNTEAAKDFWEKELSHFSYPSLISKGKHTGKGQKNENHTYENIEKVVTTALAERLALTAKNFKVSEAILFQSALAITLANYCGLRDIAFGITVSGRPPELMGIESAIGSFINNVPVRVRFDAQMAMESFLKNFQNNQLRRSSFEYVSPIQIQQYSRVPPSSPLYDLLLLWGSATKSEFHFGDLHLIQLDNKVETTAPMLLAVNKEDKQHRLMIAFDSAKIAGADAERFINALLDTLNKLCEQTHANIGQFLTGSESTKSQTSENEIFNIPEYNPSLSQTEKMRCIWQSVLGLRYVGLDDNFFDLGGSSLQASILLIQIEKKMGKVLPLSILLTAGTIAKFMTVFDIEIGKLDTMITLQASGSKAPFYIVPGIGGNVLGLKSLARGLGTDHPLIGFQSIGLDGNREPLTNIKDIAAHNLLSFPSMNQPFVIIGICWGALVAYEMAQQLTEAGKKVPLLIMMDPTSHEEQPSLNTKNALLNAKLKFVVGRLKLYFNELKQLQGKELLHWFKDKSTLLINITKSRNLMTSSASEFNQQRVTEANTQAMLNYRPKSYSGRSILLFTQDRDITRAEDTRQKWFEYLQDYDVTYIKGKDTGDAMSPENVLLLAQQLKSICSSQLR